MAPQPEIRASTTAQKNDAKDAPPSDVSSSNHPIVGDSIRFGSFTVSITGWQEQISDIRIRPDLFPKQRRDPHVGDAQSLHKQNKAADSDQLRAVTWFRLHL
ncbi:unnamed protein product [Cuscuta epithymum]|uniref:Uncharacterized protein n=1 Tax=Cuscuta epithymum TaxID=186058 RepID=A0AAV0C9B9_9ASTE|nr:unnamed protein product [Cuscuta epithymum]